MSLRQRWRAVVMRDASHDGSFVFAVRTTGIYCRPSCPARRPRRENVGFFDGPEAAERAGFRPCRRCRPRLPGGGDPLVDLVGKVCRWIESCPWERPTLTALARAAGLSPFHLQRTFVRIVGVSPRRYAEALRIDRLKERLRKGDTVTRALYQAGYGSASRLYEASSRSLGMTPAQWRAGGEGMTIGYRILPCPLGRILVAATAKGVCAVSLGDRDDRLEAALRADFPKARVRRHAARERASVSLWAAMLRQHLAGDRPHLDLPLDIRATAFQCRVYDVLRAIPPGATLAYGEIAAILGKPGAARAVGRACATNKAAVVIPCHRAVGADGDLTGYRWGSGRKKRLLEMERRARPARRRPPE